MKDWRNYTILALAIILFWSLLFRTSHKVASLEEKNKAYEEFIKSKQQEARELRDQAASLYKKRYIDSLYKIDAKRRFDEEISIRDKKLSEAIKKAKPIIDRNDTISSLIIAYDSIVTFQLARIDELVRQDRISELIARDLLSTQKAEITLCYDINTANNTIINNQRKQIKKLKTGRVLRNVAIGVAIAGGFWLGGR